MVAHLRVCVCLGRICLESWLAGKSSKPSLLPGEFKQCRLTDPCKLLLATAKLYKVVCKGYRC